MSDLNGIFNREISFEELEGVNGGTRDEWHVLNVIFNGADLFDAEALDYAGRSKLEKKIAKLTGFKVAYGTINLDADIRFKAPDGTVMNQDDFLDYIREKYTMDEILSWHQM